MDYEKKYKEALKRARQFSEHPLLEDISNIVEYIFPGFKEESEDEKVRKAAIEFVRQNKSFNYNLGISKEQVIAWLEKQGESKFEQCIQDGDKIVTNEDGTHFNVSQLERVAKKEPKFKVGDYLVNDYCKGKVIALTDDAYLLDTEQCIPFSCEHNAHLWTIQDAKDGDVIVDEDNNIGIYKEMEDTDWHSYMYLGRDNCLYGGGSHVQNNTKPVTKEQRDLLFQKMKEAGYEWDAEKKELKKIEQTNVNWCREDEQNLNAALSYINDESLCRWLKDVIHVKYDKSAWSEEDEGMFKNTIALIETLEDYNKAPDGFGDVKFWLKSLKERMKPQWKPSDEQMRALHDLSLTRNISYAGQEQKLINLYNDLRKLKE